MNELSPATESPVSATDEPDATDAQLVAQFVARRDQTAFATLLLRHGPMVFGICRRILRRHHEAEDAFQATFLSLAQHAAGIARPDHLANWLHSVARHAALKVKKVASQRQQIEIRMEVPMETIAKSASDYEQLWSDLAPVLDLEMERLPDDLRITVMLCDIEGKTRQEAARQLGWPPATVSTRLMKARSLLAQRLTRHGITLSVATLGVLLTQNAATAAVPGTLVATTLAAASTVGLAQTTAAGSAVTKVMALLKAGSPSVLAGKVALAGVAIIAVLSATFALQPESKEAQQPPPKEAPADIAHAKLVPPFEEIANTYRRNYAAIKSLKMEYKERWESLIDSDLPWNSWKLPPGANQVTLAIDHEKVHFTWSRLEDRQVHIDIFDGLKLLDNNGGHLLGGGPGDIYRPLYRIRNPSTFGGRQFLNANYLDLMLYGITGSDLPHDRKYREQFRLPDLLARGTWRVVSEHEVADGAECLVIQSSETDKLWLDPKAGFALRRWERERPGRRKIDHYDLRQVSADLWVPSRIVETGFLDVEYLDPSNPETKVPVEYQGKPSLRIHHELSVFELNQPVGPEYFQLMPLAGARVFDWTVVPLDASGQPVAFHSKTAEPQPVEYIQPENPADVPQAIKEAQLKLGTRINAAQRKMSPQLDAAQVNPGTQSDAIPPPRPRETTILWIVLVNAVLLAGGYIIYRRRSA